ncbi:hypothetical protein [Planomonospora venezuelensis]|uniref:Uncharacterized protein n=1 Tax=Planomonospora venezuelensis TaxID=1999 RepID=A0A841DD24_PLAVE|nr:hypothetical protein [Planomonospora venezuelensis]MBB5966334.1 hypothetical protein [Planomonospora venezuelensis]GIN04592.1 hypothetical protein Pve01_62500 [Planomonospora venezuelensis]
MIRRILAGAAIAGILGAAGIATASAASAGDWDRPSTTYVVDDSNHNEILNDLIDLALLGVIENED